jgi:hypothetical protein
MKKIMILVAIVNLAIIMPPAMAELTDYQKGVAAGLNTGFFMWNLSLAAQQNLDSAKEYNANVELFNKWLVSIFDNNQTMINMFQLTPLSFREPVDVSSEGLGYERRIGEYPAAAYYTATGT